MVRMRSGVQSSPLAHMKREYATYHVGLKILLRNKGSVLMLKDRRGNFFDFPGGRIDTVEHNTPLVEVLSREVSEELGESIEYRLGRQLFQYRRHFPHKNWHIFIIVYDADLISGNIKLSSEHSEYEWVDLKTFKFKKEDFCSLEEYETFTRYINSQRTNE
jgi:8-oxo-dGTP diphosphatase